jgi:protein transport protein SEC61 subunit alpha
MSELPIYGAKITDSPDPVSWLRPVLASYHGSLLEFGIGPIVATGFVFQLLGGFQLIDVDYDLRSDRELFQSAQKCKFQRFSLDSVLRLVIL